MSSTTSIPELEVQSDEEKKQQTVPIPDNEFLVGWDESNDPLNPRSFRVAYKWLIVTIVSTGSLLV